MGHSYHISAEFRKYLEKINQGKKEEEWLVKCIKLADGARLTKSNRRGVAPRKRNVKKVLEYLYKFPISKVVIRVEY